MTYSACPTCPALKLAQRLVCSACWSRVPFELQHAFKHSIAFSPARQKQAADAVVHHLQNRPAPGAKPAAPDNQLALL